MLYNADGGRAPLMIVIASNASMLSFVEGDVMPNN